MKKTLFCNTWYFFSLVFSTSADIFIKFMRGDVVPEVRSFYFNWLHKMHYCFIEKYDEGWACVSAFGGLIFR